MVFQLSLSDNKWAQLSRTFLSILVDLNNAVISMVYICALIFDSNRPFTNSLSTVLSEPITIDITVIFMFHSFF